MTSTNAIPDSHTAGEWEQLAENLRETARQMGIEVLPCHPDEAEPCGATFVAHASFYLKVTEAYINRKARYWPEEFEVAHRY